MSPCHNSFHSQQYPGNQQINSTIGNKKFRYKYDDFKKKVSIDVKWHVESWI